MTGRRETYDSNGTRVVDLPNETIVTDFYECKPPFRRCDYRGSDTHTYLGAPGTPHRQVMFTTFRPLECPRHGRRYLRRITDPERSEG